MRFSGTGAQTATLTLTATPDNIPEAGGSEMLTLAYAPEERVITVNWCL